MNNRPRLKDRLLLESLMRSIRKTSTMKSVQFGLRGVLISKEEIEQWLEDNSFEKLLLNINSPGGLK